MQSRSRLRPVGQQIAQLFDERTQAELNHVGGLEAPDRFQTAIRPKWLAQSSLSPTAPLATGNRRRSEEHTSELQSLMRISYAVFCLKKKTKKQRTYKRNTQTQQA